MSQAEIFEGFQKYVWGDDEEADELYDKYEDAREAASIMGAKPTGTVKPNDAGAEWLFPDGSTVWILNDGSGTASNLP